MTTSLPKPTIARRTIIMGAAWSLPVIAAAVAVPLAAASDSSSTINARLKWDTWRNNYTDNGAGVVTGVRTGIQLQNTYWADDSYQTVSKTILSAVVRVTYPVGIVTDSSLSAAKVTGEGWSVGSTHENADGSVTYTLLYERPIIASGSSTEANLDVPAKRVSGASASAVCSATNAEGVVAPSWGNPIY